LGLPVGLAGASGLRPPAPANPTANPTANPNFNLKNRPEVKKLGPQKKSRKNEKNEKNEKMKKMKKMKK
jgi:hypothetical protein